MKVKNSSRVILIIFLILILIGFLLRFDVIAEAVSKITGIPKDTLQNFGGHAILIGIGAVLVFGGIASIASIPVLGALLIVAGSALLIYEAVQIFNSMYPEKPIRGLKNFL